MDFEKTLMQIKKAEVISVDEARFLDQFYERKKSYLERRNRFISGSIAAGLIFLVGFLSIQQLDPELGNLYLVTDIYEEIQVESWEEDEFVTEMVVYLLEESDDIWTTLDFFNEVEYEPLAHLMEDQL